MSREPQPHEVSDYADHEILEWKDTRVPTFLKFVYVILPIWGVMWWHFFWNGSTGWLDRGFWGDLQHSANTTLPAAEHRSMDKGEPARSAEQGSKESAEAPAFVPPKWLVAPLDFIFKSS